MMWLVVPAVVVGGVLAWAHWLDHRGSPHRFGSVGADQLRNRVEGNMVMGRSWRSSRPDDHR
jgi:hypothetical protein